MKRLTLDVRAGEYTVARLAPDAEPPAALLQARADLVSITRTSGELSVVCPSELWDGAGEHEGGWRLLSVRGPLEFTLTGIIAALSSELAAAGVGLFSLSTYDTDHVLVKDGDLARAVAALRESGHDVHGLPS
ncbi:MAG: ACT domain-containing protein [Thermocrispum sp.]